MTRFRLKTGAVGLAAFTASMLTANAEFEFTFSEDSDFESVTIMAAGSAGPLADGGVGGTGGYGLGADSYLAVIANTPFSLAPGNSLSVSSMFQTALDGGATASDFFLGVGLQVEPGSAESIAGILGVNGFGAVDGLIRTDSTTDTSFASGTGSFSLTGGNWYQATATLTKETTVDQWTVNLNIADYGATGTSLVGSVYSATGNVSDSETYGVSEYYVVASFVNGLIGSSSDVRIIQAVDNFSVIPEPGTYAAIFGGIALFGAFVHRRRIRGKA